MHHHFTVGVPTLVLYSTHSWVARLMKDISAQWQWKMLEHSPWFSRYEALWLWFVSEVEGTPSRQQSATLAEMIHAAGQSITDIRTGPLMASSDSQKCGTRLTHSRTLKWRHIMIASNRRGGPFCRYHIFCNYFNTQPVHMHLFPTTFHQIPHYNTWKASSIPQNLLLFVWAVLGFGDHQWPGSAGAVDTVSALY